MILSPEEQSLIIGALDSLAASLSSHDHRWSEGERAIYEEAHRIMGSDPPPKFVPHESVEDE